MIIIIIKHAQLILLLLRYLFIKLLIKLLYNVLKLHFMPFIMFMRIIIKNQNKIIKYNIIKLIIFN